MGDLRGDGSTVERRCKRAGTHRLTHARRRRLTGRTPSGQYAATNPSLPLRLPPSPSPSPSLPLSLSIPLSSFSFLPPPGKPGRAVNQPGARRPSLLQPCFPSPWRSR